MFGKTNYSQPVMPIYTGANPTSPMFNSQPYGQPQAGYGGFSQPMPNPMSQYGGTAQPAQTAPKTNMIFVTGLEEAFQRNSAPNTQTIYFDQDKPYLYNILTDAYGKKTYETYEIKKSELKTEQDKPEIDEKQFITRDEFIAFQKQTNTLIDKLRRIVALEPSTAYSTATASAKSETPEITENKGGGGK